MSVKRIGAIVLVGLLLASMPTYTTAEDKFEDTATGKAAKETLEAMANFLNDWSEIRTLPLQQQIEVVRKNAQKRIWDKMKDQQWGVTKNAITEYAKARMRSDMFKEASLKMMHDCVVDGKSVAEMWSKYDVEIQSKMDTRMNALGKALDAVEIGYAAYKKWNEGKPEEALTDMSKAVADKFLEFMVPGWGYYRLAQSLVEALGKWVMQYAFDSALEGKINAIVPVNPKQNSEAFAKWILSVNDISGFVKREWDEQIGYGGWYAKYDGDDKTNEEAGDAMQKKIVATLETMKAEALKRKKVEDELRAKLQAEDQKTREKLSAVQAATAKTMQAMEAALAPLKKFEEKYYTLQKQDTREVVQEREEDYTETKDHVPEPNAYSPMNRSSVTAALANVYAQVGETFDRGYDEDEMSKQWLLWESIRKEELNKMRGQIKAAENKYYDAVRKWSEATQPLTLQIVAIWDEYTGKRMPDEVYDRVMEMSQQLRVIAEPFNEKIREAAKTWTSVANLAGPDRAALEAEERLVTVEAQERFSKAVQHLAKEIPTIQQDIDTAYKFYEAEGQKFSDELAKLNFPEAFEQVGGENPIAMGSIPWHRTFPEEIRPVIEPSRDALKKWKEDMGRASQIEAMREKMMKDYELAFITAKKRFENIVVERHRKMSEYGWIAEVYNFAPDVPVPSDLNVKLPYVPFDIYKKRDVSALYKKEVDQLQKRVDELSMLEPSVDIAVIYWRLLGADGGRLIPYEDQALARLNMEGLCKKKGDEYGFSVDPDDSDGAKFIEEMKAAWDANKERLEALKAMREKYIKVAVMKFKYSDPRDDQLLDMYLKIPERIEEFEKTLEKVKEERATAIKSIAENLKRASEQYATILKENRDSRDRIQRLKLLADGLRMSLSMFPTKKGLTETAEKAWDQSKMFMEKLTKHIEKLQNDINVGIYLEETGYIGSGPTGGPTPGGPSVLTGPMIGAPTYVVSDTFLNGVTANSLPPEVVVTQSDLKGGVIEMKGRISTIENVSEVAITTDGGSWTVLPKQVSFSHAFTPRPGGVYTPQIRLMTGDGRTEAMPVFMNVQRIVYKDINFEKLVVDSVGKIADSYEKQNAMAFMDEFSEDLLAGRSTLEEGIRMDFAAFTNVKLSLRISRIERRGTMFVADTQWQKSQTVRSANKELKSKGRTTFMFVFEGDTMKVKNFKGDLIYAVLSTQIAQSSGVSSDAVDKLLKEVEGTVEPTLDGRKDDRPEPSDGDRLGVPSVNTLDRGSFTLKQFNAHPGMGGWAQSYRFASKQVVDDAGFDVTGDFRRREGWIEVSNSAGVVDLGSVGLASVGEAPESGYQQAVGAYVGHVYAIQLLDGTYALVEFSAADGESVDLYEGRSISARFQYLYQRNGTREFK